MSKTILVYARHRKGVYVELAESIKDALLYYGFDAVTAYENGRPKGYDFMIEFTTKFYNNPHSEISVFVEVDHIDLVPPHRKLDYSIYTRSLHLFDYKRDLTEKNIYYCPIGYSKHFDTNLPHVDLRDSYHMGVTKYPYIRMVFRRKHNLWTHHNRRMVFGDERDSLIVTSKINVNSRAFEDYWFTPLHAALVLHKGKLYMQDDTGKDDYNWYKPYMVLFSEEDFEEKYQYWLSHDKERKEFEHFVHEDIKVNHRFEKYFYAAMGDLLEDYR